MKYGIVGSLLIFLSSCSLFILRPTSNIYKIRVKFGEQSYHIVFGSKENRGFIYNSANIRIGYFCIKRNGIEFYEPIERYFRVPHVRRVFYNILEKEKCSYSFPAGRVEKTARDRGQLIIDGEKIDFWIE